MKKKLKIRPILITTNIVLIAVILIFYGVRMIIFYKSESDVISNEGETTFLTILKNKESLVDKSKGLVFNEKKNTYTYIGNVSDNYLYYSGTMYRIIGIDASENIKLVSDKSVTLMYSGLSNGYDKSFINKWLNSSDEEHSGIFEKNLYDKQSLLTKTITCDDVVSDLTNVTCDNANYERKIGILSLYDYTSAGLKDSYLNNGETFYLNTLDEKNENYYVLNTGEIGIDNTETAIRGVRPIITISSQVKLLNGNGTIENPYIIEKHNINTLADTYVGQYITYSNMTFRIVEKNDTNVRVALNDAIFDGENYLSKTFGGSSNIFSTSSNTIGNYLNSTYYDTLENPLYIEESEWYTGTNILSNLDYSNKYSNSVKAKIGMLSLSDYYVQDVKNTLTISPGIGSSTIIITINDKNTAFGDFVASNYNIRPALNLKSDLMIVKGYGTETIPYIITEYIETNSVSDVSTIE